MIQRYAKKITGFAYSKLHNTTTAEDLSQEILLALFDGLKRQQHISDLDGYVYTICCYTWSKFLRKNKKHWHNLDVTTMFHLQDDTHVENEVQHLMQMEQLRQEVAYLAELHRKITIMFYYDNQSGDQISAALNIPQATVRWHVTQIKKKLKEGITMATASTQLSCEPKRLMVGHDGYINVENGMVGLGSYRLVDNIILACYGKKLTVEEIARQLMVASAYLEHHIAELVHMDYLRIVDKNKYTTTFFISELRHHLIASKYHYQHIAPYAKRIYEAFDKRYERIQEIGFLGSELDKDFVLWALIPFVCNTLDYKSMQAVLKRNNAHSERPKRKDGTEHWVCATLYDEHYYTVQSEFTEQEVDFHHKTRGNGIKSRDDGNGLASLQLDSYATIQTGLHWRVFDSSHLQEINRIAQIIRNQEIPNELDKLMIARFAEQGYVKIEKDLPKLLIPFLVEEEYEQLSVILDEIVAELGEEMFADYIERFAGQFEAEIPGFVSKEERIYHKYKIFPQYAILYSLAEHGYLRYPDEEEAKRLCTVVWHKRSS